MRSLIFALTALIFSLNVYSQRNDPLINPYWNFFSDNHLDAVSSGKGRTGIGEVGDISSTVMNPAAFEIEKKYQVNVQYTYKTNQPWLQGLGISDLYLKQNVFAGIAGFGYKLNKHLNAGLVYSNPYSMDINVGEIIRTNEFGQEIGRYEAYEKYSSHNLSIPISYKFKKFRIGITLNYTLHRRYFNFEYEKFVVKFDRFNADAGILVDISEHLTFGLKFRPEAKGQAKYYSDSISQIDEYTDVLLPMQIGTGVSYTIPMNKLNFAADYTFIQGSKIEGLSDQHWFNFGIQYPLNKYWTIRGGFFNAPEPRDFKTSYINPEESYSQFFLTAGASVKSDIAVFSLAIMDSHISSSTLKYTFITGGLNLNF
jgi:long-subunit fatty acid transport protein